MTDTERERINAICEVAGVAEIDDLSDGFHTFRQLYYQRMMLFATIVKQNKDKAWKSLRHEDGELCFGGGWFIVGIDTPKGSYTYHYENKYFDLFDCEILDYGKHWDGHTEKDVTRLLSLPDVPDINDGDIISRQAAIDVTWFEPSYTDPLNVLTEVRDRLKALPSAQPEQECEKCIFKPFKQFQPERKKGKWIKMSDTDGIYWACSECGEDLPRVSRYNPQFDLFPRLESIEKTNFCSNCGADMRGEQDE